jgi:muramoyltetrapeptide carboxypeptidase LdcA involved in peptidoglycan recycling
MGVSSVLSDHIFANGSVYSGTGKERAEDLMRLYRNDSIDVIFDISGGDLANEVLPWIDFGMIAEAKKMFFGYSDLTTILNAIYTKTGRASVLYQTLNLVGTEGEKQQKRFQKSILQGQEDLYRFRYSFLQGTELHGIVIGGNIRCFLKLAGTPYFPNIKGKILLLEAMSGGVAKIATYLSQLDQIGVFKEVSGIILGTFTMLGENPFELLRQYISSDLPVVQTPDIGHGQDANAVKIGGYIDCRAV